MHEALRRRILRRLETLPEARLYQVVDYIEFLESKYSESAFPEEVSGLQRLAEHLEDGLRSRTISPSRLREAFQLISAADRVLGSLADVGRDIFSDSAGGVAERHPKGKGDARGEDGGHGASPEREAAANRSPEGGLTSGLPVG